MKIKCRFGIHSWKFGEMIIARIKPYQLKTCEHCGRIKFIWLNATREK